MNEPIEKLFDQALEEFKAENKYATVVVPDPIQRDFVEKFAQLIVQECANFFAQRFEKAKMEGPTIYVDMTPEEIEREHCFYDGYLLALDNVGISLKEHFGVEE